MPRAGALLIVLLALGLLGLLWRSQQQRDPYKVSGVLEAHLIRLGSRVGGRVRRVNAHEGQRVAAGEVLVELESFDLLERRAQAKALLAERTAQRERMDLGYRPEEIEQARARRDQLAARNARVQSGARPQEVAAARARVAQAEAELKLVEQRHARTTDLFKTGVAAQDQMDVADNERKAAQSALAVRNEELALLLEGSRSEDKADSAAQLAEAEAAFKLRQNGFTKEERAAAAAAVDAAAAALAAIDRQVEETTVKAPAAAVVEALELRPGDLVPANAPVLSLLDPTTLWVRAYVPESRLDVKPGTKASVTVDAFPGRRFAATVGFVAREAEFTPRNVQTPEERSKQVFRVKVTLDEGLDVLRAGMAADVWLERAP